MARRRRPKPYICLNVSVPCLASRKPATNRDQALLPGDDIAPGSMHFSGQSEGKQIAPSNQGAMKFTPNGARLP